MRRKPIHPMSLEEIENLSTKQLLARLRQLHQCEESTLLSDRDDASNASGTILFKDTPEWKVAYDQVKGTLSVREHVHKGDRKMKSSSWIIMAVIGLAALYNPAIAQSAPSPSGQKSPDVASRQARSVKDQVLTSQEMPAVRIEFDKGFKYVGGHSFILYDVAHAEQHFFVDADKDGRVKRMYWVQFEGYLPSNTHTYRYKVNKTTNIGGLEFIADAYARNIKGNPGRPDSDGARARAFLEGKGYRMASDDVLSQRLVHLVDEAKRNELMIIYMEDLSGMGLTAADLAEAGRAAARWNEISNGLLDRAVKGMKVQR